MSDPKRHHFVPQMYLALFGNARREVQVVRLATGRSTTESTRKVAASNHFYRVEVDGEQSVHMETAAAALESRAAPVLKETADPQQRKWPLPRDTRLNVAFFLAFQHLRVPTARDALEALHEVLPELLRNAGVEAGATDLNLPLLHGASMLGPALPSGAAELCDRSWTIVDFQRKSLATSDVPVMALRDEHTTDRTPAGLAAPGGLYIPLARRTALIIGPPGTSEQDDRCVAGSTRLARALNETTARWARDALFHHPDDDPLQGIDLPGPRRGKVCWEYVTAETLRESSGRPTAGGQIPSAERPRTQGWPGGRDTDPSPARTPRRIPRLAQHEYAVLVAGVRQSLEGELYRYDLRSPEKPQLLLSLTANRICDLVVAPVDSGEVSLWILADVHGSSQSRAPLLVEARISAGTQT
ncbi:DUF4238 domain-containing protein [Kitasatospora sp. NPDC008115]|uniref:DUF4238 domain-containing protein n=1 Tax=Kitasatospora sp. NPDC008115 TaxID=3364022 RepID=UPI0036E57233